MMNPSVDKSLVGLVVGQLVGLAVMKGFVDPANADQIIQLVNAVLGGAIALVAIIGYFAHHIKAQDVQAQKIKQEVPPAI